MKGGRGLLAPLPTMTKDNMAQKETFEFTCTNDHSWVLSTSCSTMGALIDGMVKCPLCGQAGRVIVNIAGDVKEASLLSIWPGFEKDATSLTDDPDKEGETDT